MTEVIEHTDRKARKEYTCDYCGEKIAKGETYDYYKGKYDGSLFTWRSHLACQRVANAVWEYADPDEGMSEDLFQDSCAQVCCEFICPDCESWDKEYNECDNDESYCIDKMDKFFETHELYFERKGYYRIWKCREKVRGMKDEQD